MKYRYLFLLSFIEGSALMIVELCGSKMIAPCYGTSFYVWASTLGITLAALAIGYYIGGRISQRRDKILQHLFSISLYAGLLICLMPNLSNAVMKWSLDYSFLKGLVISQLVYLLPPIILLGMVSPFIISYITTDTRYSGKNAGSIYAISTIGGIIFTLVFGFYILSNYGIKKPLYCTGGLLIFYSLFFLFKYSWRLNYWIAGSLVLAIFIFRSSKGDRTDQFQIVYSTEGVMGQIKVVDEIFSSGFHLRYLLVNHNWMNAVDVNDIDYCFNSFVPIFKSLFHLIDEKEKILSIGLGGGFTTDYLMNHNHDVMSIDIEPRMKDVAIQYFGLRPDLKFVADDGRHYINTTPNNTYSTIIVNALLGDNIPSNMLSQESLTKMHSVLTDNGKLIIDFDGIHANDDGMAQSSLYKTLLKAGFQVEIFTSIKDTLDAELIYFAMKTKIGTDHLSVHQNVRNGVDTSLLNQYKVTNRIAALQTGEILTDNKPLLEYALRDRAIYVRKKILNKINDKMLEYNAPIFN